MKKQLRYYFIFLLAMGGFFIGTVSAEPDHDLSNEKVLYVVGTAHLDTQWRWTIQDTIESHIKKTLDNNFSLFEQYPDYVFSFEGAFRYMLMKEYYPSRYETMSNYIDQGRWHVAGSTLENGDMNVVSPESLIRQTLIGNNYFEDEFGKRSTDIFLPDCFGFSYTMPTWMTHCGLNGFSSQKLTWGSSIGIPFNVGVWKGPDGSSIVAALNPGAYTSSVSSDLSNDSGWLSRINNTGNSSGVYADYKYHGTGDTGGSPSSDSCSWLETSIAGDGPITVVSAGSDDLFNDITPEQKASLDVYDGEMLMTKHGNGCYTSQTAMKRWNRKNELLADSAERVAAFADFVGGVDYPSDMFSAAWIRFLWHSFHDDITGTSIPEAYHFSWNDEILSLNQFASILTDSVGAIAQKLNTGVQGEPLVVYNTLAVARTDTVEATVVYDDEVPAFVKVFDGETELPSQVLSRSENSITVAFIGTVPSVGLKVFDVRSSDEPCSLDTSMSGSVSVLENAYLKVSIDSDGNIASVYDKVNSREMFSEPARLDALYDYSDVWPAWEIRYEDVQSLPLGYVKDEVKAELVENGPARAAVEITRTYGDSTFIQRISLAAEGLDAMQVTVDNLVDWRTKETMVKAAFPLSVSNEYATYDLGMGTIQRSNNRSSLYEVPAQQWVDLASTDGSYGVSIFSDCKYGWDKPSNNQVRLTLLHTPGVNTSYTDESTQDLGQHKFAYAIAGHAGSWTDSDIPYRAAGMNQPLLAFQSAKHETGFTNTLSFVTVSNSQAMVKAVKKADKSDQIIVRLQELYGENADDVLLSSVKGIVSASIVDGCEKYIQDAEIVDGKVKFNLTPYQPMTIAITLDPIVGIFDEAESQTVSLSYNMDAFSYDSNRSDGNFDDGMTYPAELVKSQLVVDGITFNLGDKTNGSNNALACQGQTVALGSTASYDTLYILAAARGGDTTGDFTISGVVTTLGVQDYHENVVDWGRESDIPFMKNDQVAWVGTHRHEPSGNMAYEFCNMYLYELDMPEGASSVTLPDNSDIVIFAVSKGSSPAKMVKPAVELYDSLPFIPELAPKPETRTNLALNKPVYADSNVGSELPEYAVDGTTRDNSKWCATGSEGDVHWLAVDLQQNYDVDTFVVRHAGAGGEGTNWNTSDFCIQSSADGSNWEDLVCVEGNTESVTRNTIAPVNVRYLRLYITDPTQDTNTAVRIYEFEVYGPCDGTVLNGDISGVDGEPDCMVDLFDLQTIAKDWLSCNDSNNAACNDYWDNFAGSYNALPVLDASVALPPVGNLVARWDIKEGSGTTVHDLAGSDAYATLGGNSVPTWSTGWFSDSSNNYSLYFNTSGYLQVDTDLGAASDLFAISDAMTISAWVNAVNWGDGKNRRIIQKGNSDNQYRLLVENNELKFHIHNVGTITAELPSAGVWHHVAAVYTGDKMSLYVDGIEKKMIYASGTINYTDDNLYIGTKKPDAPSGDYFYGNLDDIRIYDTGLTAAQVRYLASESNNLPPVIVKSGADSGLICSAGKSADMEVLAFDADGDQISYQWQETNGSQNVSFSPSDDTAKTKANFSQAGSYSITATISDGSGYSDTVSFDYDIVDLDAETLIEKGYGIKGDVNVDSYVNVLDLQVCLASWLDCAEYGCK